MPRLRPRIDSGSRVCIHRIYIDNRQPDPKPNFHMPSGTLLLNTAMHHSNRITRYISMTFTYHFDHDRANRQSTQPQAWFSDEATKNVLSYVLVDVRCTLAPNPPPVCAERRQWSHLRIYRPKRIFLSRSHRRPLRGATVDPAPRSRMHWSFLRDFPGR